MRRGAWLAAGAIATLVCGADVHGVTQEVSHTPPVSGMPHGVPRLCSPTTVVSETSGTWSDPRTWSTGAVPGAGARVAVAASHTVTYDIAVSSPLDCIEVRGHLAFSAIGDTRLRVATIMILEGGHLEIGSSDTPIPPHISAELIIADRPIDLARDPGQVGTGIVGLGKVTMRGAPKRPTFVRLGREPLAGQTVIELAHEAEGWMPGDSVVIPDTRQLRGPERGDRYAPQTERLQIAAISGMSITLTTPLRYDHRGARDVDNRLDRLPHVGNLSRNITVRSENPDGTRGHTMFISRADVDLRYAAFQDLGRTKNGAVDSTQFDTSARTQRIGTNQLGRYAVHFHHTFGPAVTPSNGHQFTFVGNAVEGAPKWGITVHRSHHGLIQDNVVFDTQGAGIATEDGSESYNVFARNFSVQSTGRRDAMLGGGYGGSAKGLGVEGAGFWFRGPNNYIRDNVAASATTYGFALPERLGSVRIPTFKGADTSRADEATRVDMTEAAVLEFANNEAYGAIETGLEWVWNGTVSSFSVWHPSQHGFIGLPPERLTLESLVVRGDVDVLGDPSEELVGVSIANYVSRQVHITQADVQATRVGVLSPFFYSQTPVPGRGAGSLIVEDSYFAGQVGVSIATSYQLHGEGGEPVKRAVVRGSRFETLDLETTDGRGAAISMNWGMTPQDAEPRDPIAVFDFNRQPGQDFKVYYSYEAPLDTAPCHETRPDIAGWVCE